jgi:hypothetical protein
MKHRVNLKLSLGASISLAVVMCNIVQSLLIKERWWYIEHNYLLLCMVDSNRPHVSTIHAGHLQDFTNESLKCYRLYIFHDITRHNHFAPHYLYIQTSSHWTKVTANLQPKKKVHVSVLLTVIFWIVKVLFELQIANPLTCTIHQPLSY